MRNTTSSRGRPPHAYIMNVSWPIKGVPIVSTKNLSIIFCFYLFCPNFLFQTSIMFSLHPGGGLICFRWPCRPRATLRRASPDGVPPEGAIQGDRREIVQHTGANGQTVTRHGQTASYCPTTARPSTQPVRPPAPRTKTLGSVSGTRGHVRVMATKLSTSTYTKVCQVKTKFLLIPQR
jgi:hypothetical protein